MTADAGALVPLEPIDKVYQVPPEIVEQSLEGFMIHRLSSIIIVFLAFVSHCWNFKHTESMQCSKIFDI